MSDCVTSKDINRKVKTPYDIGILVYVDAGAAFYVEPLDKNEEWEDYQFESKDLERIDE